jgi:mRNA interferase YafQ
MALDLLTTTAFERDLRRVEKQGKDLDKLEAVVDLLQAQKPLPARCRPHPLRGDWSGHWDCHVEADWLLLYRVTVTQLILVRTGSHAELFR